MTMMIDCYNGSLYGNYRTEKFTDYYPDVTTFLNEYHDIGLPVTIDDTNASTLYYLLYARYGNDHIASSDPNRFKYDMFRIIWQYGPNWVKKLEIQTKLRGLTEKELLEGSRQIYNNASNPSVNPSNFTDEELQYINNQNVTKSKKGTLEGYGLLMGLLEDDVTEAFLAKFKKLFLTIVMPELPLWYVSEGEDSYE